MATLREVLTPWGLDRIKMDPWIREHSLDVTLKAYMFAVSPPRGGEEPHGMLQMVCRGVVIAQFFPDTVSGRPLDLCMNDERGEMWDLRRRQGAELHEIGERPHPTLELVQTA